MQNDMVLLGATAASIGFVHTLVGPDHYLPFIMMAKAQRWSKARTLGVTVICGVGHVLGSVLLGCVGIVLGIGVTSLEATEAVRGSVAAWGLVAFGLGYCVWGLRRAVKKRPHTHRHVHEDGSGHIHEHNHHREHCHVHETGQASSITPWVLFVVFVLGPCEPLIPILMYPAAKSSLTGVVWVTALFGTVTILTMTGIVALSSWGFSFVPLKRMERYAHALAGGCICLSGLAIQLLGL